jgi:hypothetical protein
VDVGRVLEEDEAGALGVVVGGPAQALGGVDGAQVPVGLPPDRAVAVDGAFAGDGDIVLVARVDQRRRPGHLNAGDAGGEFGVVGCVLRTDQRDALGNVEGNAGLEEDRPDEVGAGLEGDGAAFGCGLVDGLLDRHGVQ